MSGPSLERPASRVIVVADGDLPSRAALDAAWPGWDAGADRIVAADGGAAAALQLGLRPDLVIGDLDSIAPADLQRVHALGIPVEARPRAKEESDTELALGAALGSGPAAVTILGALGGSRFDHALANVWLLALPGLAGYEVVLLDARCRVRLLRGPGRVALRGPVGDLVSLLPFAGPAEGVSTEGLAYPLREEPLTAGPSRGLSNVRRQSEATVSLRSGALLIVETHPIETHPPEEGAP